MSKVGLANRNDTMTITGCQPSACCQDTWRDVGYPMPSDGWHSVHRISGGSQLLAQFAHGVRPIHADVVELVVRR